MPSPYVPRAGIIDDEETAMLGERIGQGRTAEVFALDAQRVVKLFRSDWPAEDAAHEERMARAIAAAGVPAPAVFGTMESAGRYGVIYERITGPSLEAWVGYHLARLPEGARITAATHARIHAGQPRDLPAQHEVLARRIRRATLAPQAVREAALARLAALPPGTTLCHGDFHWGNILLGQKGPVVIDWENATSGDPLADVARSLLLMQMGWVYGTSWPLRRTIQAATWYVTAAYLRHYRRLRGADMARLRAWRLPVVVARLCEGITQEQPHLLRLAARLAHEA
jgi:uncharacterized protein (TIGR02172 family)